MNMEMVTMQLIVNSGDARSKAMEAVACAKQNNFAQAGERLKEAKEFLTKAHEFQTNLIQEEAEGNVEKVSILTAHAQDHLMNAITVIDMAGEFIDLYQKVFQLCEKE